MSKIITFMPLSYLFYSRIDSIKEALSWIYLFPAFCFFVCFFYGSTVLSLVAILKFVVIFLTVISVYEIGYLFNDLKSSSREKEPSIRVSDCWYQDNFGKLVFLRGIFSLLFFAIFYYVSEPVVLLQFFIAVLLLSLAFYLHNRIRGRFNVITFLILSFFKYYSVVFLVDDYYVFLLIFFSFPLLRSIEYGLIKGYISLRFAKDLFLNDRHFFRFLYLLFITLFSFVILSNNNISVYYIFIPLYFLVFRFFLFSLNKDFILKRFSK